MPKGVPTVSAPSSFDIYEGVPYQEYWTSASQKNIFKLEETIVRELLPARGNLVVDIGCGYGRLANCYKDRFNNIVMFDGSRSLLLSAQKMIGDKAWYIWGDVNHLPFQDAVFDCVLMVRVFQLILDSTQCLQTINRILCQDGHFIFNYSNKRNPYRVMRYLSGLSKYNPLTKEPIIGPHIFHHHPEYVSGLLADSGFDVLTYRGAGVFNKIVEYLGPLSDRIPSGASFAPLLGKLFLAPWIFCQTRVRKEKPSRPVSDVGSLLLCPQCGANILQDSSYFECTQCRKKYPIEDGIIDMRMI